MRPIRYFPALLALLAVLSAPAPAQQANSVDVKDAWVRATVPGQKGTGAFMKITSREPMRLVGAASPVAGVTEIHEMKLEGDVMRMRAMPNGLELPAGKTVEFKSGSYHVMLMDLKGPLVKDGKVPLTLVLRDVKGVDQKLELQLPVQAGAPAMSGHKH